MTPTPPLLEIRGVHYAYGQRICALRDVSLEVRAGEVVALIGNNGAGKSTLMKAISGLVTPQAGSIYFDGNIISGQPAHEIVRRGLALVPEGRRIFPRLTVAENLEMGGYTLAPSQARAQMDEMIGLFPILRDRQAQFGGTLSGGEQQMLAMARALMGAPRLLLLDEPSMGLAPVIVDKIFEIIAAIQARGVTVLIVEQNAQRALRASGRAYVLETGQIVLSKDSATLLADPNVRRAYLGLQ